MIEIYMFFFHQTDKVFHYCPSITVYHSQSQRLFDLQLPISKWFQRNYKNFENGQKCSFLKYKTFGCLLILSFLHSFSEGYSSEPNCRIVRNKRIGSTFLRSPYTLIVIIHTKIDQNDHNKSV